MHKPVSSMPPAVQEFIRAYLQRRPVCMLCRGPCHKVFVLLPQALPPDLAAKQEGCVFSLCEACIEREDRDSRILAALHADKRDQEAVPWN